MVEKQSIPSALSISEKSKSNSFLNILKSFFAKSRSPSSFNTASLAIPFPPFGAIVMNPPLELKVTLLRSSVATSGPLAATPPSSERLDALPP